jgi:hypothetical protein
VKFPKPVKRVKARKPLRRTWMRKKAPRRLSRAGSDPAYLAWVRSRGCEAGSYQCAGWIHAHHAIHRSQGGRDDVAIPLCGKHHQDWHNHTGPFRGLSRLQLFAWSMAAIERTQRAYLEARP